MDVRNNKYRDSARFKCRLLLTLFCFMLTGGTLGFASSAEKVTLTTHNLHPYGSYPAHHAGEIIADETFTGVAADLIKCVFEKLDIPLEIQVLPWKRAQLSVQEGRADGFFAASQNDAREEYAVRSVVVAEQKWTWYLLKDNPWTPQDPAFKAKATVGGFLGANMLDWMKEHHYNVTAMPIDTEGLLNMLLAGRVDAVMANNYVMNALLQEYGVEDQVKSYPNKDKPLYIYFSKEFLKSRPAFIENFDNMVPQCRN